MRRHLYGAAVMLALVLAPAAPAVAHKGSASKADRYLTKAVRAADSRAENTGKVSVTNCKAARGHRHKFACRVSVQLIKSNGQSRTCSDRSITVLLKKAKYRLAKSTYLNRGTKCTRLTQLPPPPEIPPPPPATNPVTPVVPPTPPTGNPPPTPPTAPPTGPAPPPPPRGPAAIQAAATYTDGYYYPWFESGGYYWTVGEWFYQGFSCESLYRAWWWWNGYGWVYYTERWIVADPNFGGLHYETTSPPCD